MFTIIIITYIFKKMEGAQEQKPTMFGRKIGGFSISLSKVLRHDAVNLGLTIREDGFINLKEVLGVHYIAKMRPNMADIRAVVSDNKKKRFELIDHDTVPGEYLIRAVQGHTIKEV